MKIFCYIKIADITQNNFGLIKCEPKYGAAIDTE